MTSRSMAVLAGLLLTGPTWAATGATSSVVDAIALYSQGSAVVQDRRSLNLKRGEQTVAWPVVGDLQAGTLWLAGDGVRLMGTSRADSDLSLSHRVGRSVTVIGADGDRRSGTLIGVEDAAAYVRIDDRIERIPAASGVRIGWQSSNDGDDTNGLRLDVAARRAGRQDTTATYQTDAPSWQASTTGRFDPEREQLTLRATAIIDNAGYLAIDADRAWLIAGDTARVDRGAPRPMAAQMKTRATGPAEAAEKTGDVYRYPLADGLHIAAGASRSIALFEPVTVEAQRRYRFENYATQDTGSARRHVRASLAFDNDTDRPWPAGAVRIYDAAHTAQLMGESRIDDTPAGAPVRIDLGGAFDVTGQHRIIEQQTDDRGRQTTRVAIDLYNAGQRATDVTIAERLPHDAQLADSDSAPNTSGGSANQPEWQVTVPASGHQRLTYRFTTPARS